MARRWRRFGLWVVAVIGGPVLLYLGVALLLGALPANSDWKEPERGITIFVRSNGVHTWIVMPKVTPEFDWRPLVPGAHLPDARYAPSDHVAIGYGQREFYLETPSWAELRLGTALWAASGAGSALVHVEHVHAPQPEEWQRPLRLSPDSYRRLVRHVAASFRRDGQGRYIPLIGRGFGPSDVFYESDGGYSALFTCNSWTGRALRAAGMRMGLWTPLEQSIMWRLRD